ncbi:MAG: hypothetical protein FWB80_09555 [Defluviitaleaceae bacterium]|nr:hypothetical protein [Defluviitaleaceae bacterium]
MTTQDKIKTYDNGYLALDTNYGEEEVYWKGYINRTQIQYTAKGSSVAA